MENTYTYTARSALDPARVVTLTLYENYLSVGVATPLEHIERAVRAATAEEEDEARGEIRLQPWLRPAAISMIERGLHPFHVGDVEARADERWLRVRAWFRTGGLRFLPVTLVGGEVDNPEAAQAFVRELRRRKKAAGGPSWLFGLLDYWATWIVGGVLAVVFMQLWRRKRGRESA